MTNPTDLVTTAINLPDITPIDGGWRIKTSADGTHHVDVLLMLFNARIALTPVDDPTYHVRHWCYAGNDFASLLRAIGAALAWDGSLDSEPDGWNKNGQTREWRQPA